uniref:Uncharacterized protein n=1 Tax=Oryza meridionalis TaxID=40149 RepID=A0A0E0D709_9ORYZ
MLAAAVASCLIWLRLSHLTIQRSIFTPPPWLPPHSDPRPDPRPSPSTNPSSSPLTRRHRYSASPHLALRLPAGTALARAVAPPTPFTSPLMPPTPRHHSITTPPTLFTSPPPPPIFTAVGPPSSTTLPPSPASPSHPRRRWCPRWASVAAERSPRWQHRGHSGRRRGRWTTPFADWRDAAAVEPEVTAAGKPRLVFAPPSREEAEEATTELRDAIDR